MVVEVVDLGHLSTPLATGADHHDQVLVKAGISCGLISMNLMKKIRGVDIRRTYIKTEK